MSEHRSIIPTLPPFVRGRSHWALEEKINRERGSAGGVDLGTPVDHSNPPALPRSLLISLRGAVGAAAFARDAAARASFPLSPAWSLPRPVSPLL
jgi:hypothetical protein